MTPKTLSKKETQKFFLQMVDPSESIFVDANKIANSGFESSESCYSIIQLPLGYFLVSISQGSTGIGLIRSHTRL
jgi:hypothetical protein